MRTSREITGRFSHTLSSEKVNETSLAVRNGTFSAHGAFSI